MVSSHTRATHSSAPTLSRYQKQRNRSVPKKRPPIALVSNNLGGSPKTVLSQIFGQWVSLPCAGLHPSRVLAPRRDGRVAEPRGGGLAGPRESSDRLACRAMRTRPVRPAFRVLLTFASRSGSRSGASVPGCSSRVLGVSLCLSSACSAQVTEREDVCVSGGTSPTAAGVEARESSRTRASKAAVLRPVSSHESVRWCRFVW